MKERNIDMNNATLIDWAIDGVKVIFMIKSLHGKCVFPLLPHKDYNSSRLSQF